MLTEVSESDAISDPILLSLENALNAGNLYSAKHFLGQISPEDKKLERVLIQALQTDMHEIAREVMGLLGAENSLPEAFFLLQKKFRLVGTETERTHAYLVNILQSERAFSFDRQACLKLQNTVLYMIEEKKDDDIRALMVPGMIEKLDLNVLLMAALEKKHSEIGVLLVEKGATALLAALVYVQSRYGLQRWGWSAGNGYEKIRQYLVQAIVNGDNVYEGSDKKQLHKVVLTLIQSNNERARQEIQLFLKNQKIVQSLDIGLLMEDALIARHAEAIDWLAEIGACDLSEILLKMQEERSVLSKGVWKTGSFAQAYGRLTTHLTKSSLSAETERERVVHVLNTMIKKKEQQAEILLNTSFEPPFSEKTLLKLLNSALDVENFGVALVVMKKGAREIASGMIVDQLDSKKMEAWGKNYLEDVIVELERHSNKALKKTNQEKFKLIIALKFMIKGKQEKALALLDDADFVACFDGDELDLLLWMALHYGNGRAVRCLIGIGSQKNRNLTFGLVKAQTIVYWITDDYEGIVSLFIDRLVKKPCEFNLREKVVLQEAMMNFLNRGEVDFFRRLIDEEWIREQLPLATMLLGFLRISLKSRWNKDWAVTTCRFLIDNLQEDAELFSEKEKNDFSVVVVSLVENSCEKNISIKNIVLSSRYLLSQIRQQLFVLSLQADQLALARLMIDPIIDDRDLSTLILMIHKMQINSPEMPLSSSCALHYKELTGWLNEPEFFLRKQDNKEIVKLAPKDRVFFAKIVEFFIFERRENLVDFFEIPHIKANIDYGHITRYAITIGNFCIAKKGIFELSKAQEDVSEQVFLALETSLKIKSVEEGNDREQNAQLRVQLALLLVEQDCPVLTVENEESRLYLILQDMIEMGDDQSFETIVERCVFEPRTLTIFLDIAFEYQNSSVVKYLQAKKTDMSDEMWNQKLNTAFQLNHDAVVGCMLSTDETRRLTADPAWLLERSIKEGRYVAAETLVDYVERWDFTGLDFSGALAKEDSRRELSSAFWSKPEVFSDEYYEKLNALAEPSQKPRNSWD